MVRFLHFHCWGWVQFEVGKIRSCRVRQKKKERKNFLLKEKRSPRSPLHRRGKWGGVRGDQGSSPSLRAAEPGWEQGSPDPQLSFLHLRAPPYSPKPQNQSHYQATPPHPHSAAHPQAWTLKASSDLREPTSPPRGCDCPTPGSPQVRGAGSTSSSPLSPTFCAQPSTLSPCLLHPGGLCRWGWLSPRVYPEHSSWKKKINK